jgi:hypothetical protein
VTLAWRLGFTPEDLDSLSASELHHWWEALERLDERIRRR